MFKKVKFPVNDINHSHANKGRLGHQPSGSDMTKLVNQNI